MKLKTIMSVMLAACAGSVYAWNLDFAGIDKWNSQGIHTFMSAGKQYVGIGDSRSWAMVKRRIENGVLVLDTRECMGKNGKYLVPNISIRAVAPASLKLNAEHVVQTTLDISGDGDKLLCTIRYWGPVKGAKPINDKKIFTVGKEPLVFASPMPSGLQSLEVNVTLDSPGVYRLKSIAVDSVPAGKTK